MAHVNQLAVHTGKLSAGLQDRPVELTVGQGHHRQGYPGNVPQAAEQHRGREGETATWGAMAAAVGGDNIAAPFVEWYGPMNPEKVLAAQPEVVFIAGTESTKNQTSMLLGQGVARWLSDPRRLKLFNYSMAAMLILSLAPVLELAK